MRKPRIQFQDALYHVIARGNNRQRVFLVSGDYVRYLKFLGEILQAYDFSLLAYALMGNHVHLLLRQGSGPSLSRLIHRLHTAYTHFFNYQHKRVGHLFQGRYKSILVDSEIYLLQLVRYIHLNPARAGLEGAPGRYPWTGHGQYLKKDPRPLAPVSTGPVLKMFSELPGLARRSYQKFVLEGLGDGHRDDLYNLRDGRVLGDEAFQEKVQRVAGLALGPARKGLKTPREFWDAFQKAQGISGKLEGWHKSRLMGEAAYWMVRHEGISGKTVAEFFRVDPSTITKAIRRQEKMWERSPDLWREREKRFLELR